MRDIIVDKFKLRDYQRPIWKALDDGYKRLLIILPRRSGKDLTCWNLLIREAIRKPGIYFYILPTYSQGRKIVFDSMTNDGIRFLDFLPKEAVDNINITQMKISFKNGSIIQVQGSDNIDRLVGTNPRGILYSEYALQDSNAYTFLRPCLTANDGWACFVSTPRGHNGLYDLYNIALQNPNDWFCLKLTVEDTKHVSLDEIQKELDSGEMSEDLVQQEWYCSFDLGVEGSYYSKYLNNMRLQHRIGVVDWDPSYKVNACFDLGIHDATTILWYQVIGTQVRFIDCYSATDQSLAHYAKVLQQKPYVMNKYFGPHDLAVRELGTGLSRLETARQLGISFSIVANIGVEDGIEAVRGALQSKVWISDTNCKDLLKALESYRREYDNKKKVYKDHPLHDWSSHYADNFRYAILSLPKSRDSLTPEDLDRQYREAMSGSSAGLPRIFRDDNPTY